MNARPRVGNFIRQRNADAAWPLTPNRTEPALSAKRSKWDRPPPPHDWRWIVGGLGRVLLSLGVLMFGFVTFQLWGTGIQTARAQERLEDDFEELLSSTPAVTQRETPAADEPEAANGSSGSSTPTEDVVRTTASASTTSAAAATTVPTATTAATRPTPVPPRLGEPVARLEIPSIGVDKIVIEGVRATDLEKGPGHFPETPLPGQLGNAAIAGHRTTYGQPFIDIDDIQPGAEVIVTTVSGRYVYRMTTSIIVGPDDYALVIPTRDATKATLVLTSCHPKYSAKQRIVVTAELDAAASTAVALPRPPMAPSTSAPATTMLRAEESTEYGTSAIEPVTTAAASGPPADGRVAVPTTLTTAVAVGRQPPPDSQELFESRWFGDRDAWPVVALWGLSLTAVALGSAMLSRRLRRDWAGAAVGIGPFVVALYLFYDNVNRLLPPAL